MVLLFLYTVDGVMIDCLVMSWPWSLSSIMRLFTSLVSWGLVYFQRKAYMHVCSLKIGQLLQPDSLFSVCCQMHDSRLSLWQTLLPKISQRMMGKLLYNHTQVTPSAVACFTARFWWARFKACWALFKNWRTVIVFSSHTMDSEGVSILIVKLGNVCLLFLAVITFAV